MRPPSVQLLVQALTTPEVLPSLTMPQWDALIRQARAADMLARIAQSCSSRGILDALPPGPRRHLESASILAKRQQRELQWEVQMIEQALAPIEVPVVLLKGAAYAMCRLEASHGRTMSDVDILVPHDQLPNVESSLMKRGWVSSAESAYDQRYYRTWMHELPPMRHFLRHTVIDVHHAILPRTARSHPSSVALMASARPLKPGGRIMVLAPVDMLLHSATHLFHEGELEQGFRGLVDIDSLLREFAARENSFWSDLVPRALELELTRPLFYALRYVKLTLGTPIPDSALDAVAQTPGARKPGARLAFMDFLFLRALRPAHRSTSDGWTPLARWLLYLRGHWLRMPPLLLVVHLGRKLLSPKKNADTQAAA